MLDVKSSRLLFLFNQYNGNRLKLCSHVTKYKTDVM